MNYEFKARSQTFAELQRERDAWRQIAIDTQISEYEGRARSKEQIIADLERQVTEKVAK